MAYLPSAGEPSPKSGRGFAALWRLFPALCPLCQEDTQTQGVCAHCQAWLARDSACLCPRCGLNLGHLLHCPDCQVMNFAFEQVFSAFDYAFPGEQLIHRLKIQARFDLVPDLARLLLQCWQHHRANLPSRCVWVAVPARRASIRQRGFSPTALLARELARLTAWPDCSAAIRWRKPHEQAQKHRSRMQRLAAMRQAWLCQSDFSGQHLVLVDDVMTTGASMDALARLCLQAGARQVDGLVLARAPWQGCGR